MKHLLPILAGVILCLISTAAAFLVPHVHAFSYLTLALAVITGLLCVAGIIHYAARGTL